MRAVRDLPITPAEKWSVRKEKYLRENTGAARCPSCSQNAHDETVLAEEKSASRRARGWAGEKIARSEGQRRPRPILGALIAMAHDCVVAPTRISEDTKLDLL
jgi:hypothetical protein